MVVKSITQFNISLGIKSLPLSASSNIPHKLSISFESFLSFNCLKTLQNHATL